MKTEEARFILQARRPGGADDDTPLVSAALAQAARDPLPGEWLAREARWDTAVSRAVGQVRAPADLRSLILAGAAAQAQPVRRWWLHPAALGLAAALAVVASVAGFWLRPTASVGSGDASVTLASVDGARGTLRTLARHETRGAHPPGVHADVIGEVGRWLETPGRRITGGLPVDFDTLRALGCRSFKLGGKEVLEVCFGRDRYFHLYVGRRSDFPSRSGAADGVVDIEVSDGVAVASWHQGELVHVIAVEGDREVLAAVL